jgi:imidazolonepropionase-like amidohydrolase
MLILLLRIVFVFRTRSISLWIRSAPIAMSRPSRHFRQRLPGIALLAAAAVLALPAWGGPRGVAGGDRLAFALTGARVIVAPGRVVDPGVVVIRGGVIEAVGLVGQTAVPADARVFDLPGKVVHAAFVDPYVTSDRLAGRKPRKPPDDEESEAPGGSSRGAGGEAVAADRVIESLTVKEQVADAYRRLGFGAVAAVPSDGILRGAGAVVSLADGPLEDRVLRADFGQYVSLDPDRLRGSAMSRGAAYPASKMGAVALVRQGFLDALWWRDAEAAYTRSPAGQERPPWDASAAALLPAAEGKRPVVFETTGVLSLLRAAGIAREMKLNAQYVGGGDEYRLRDELAALEPDLILRVDFPRPDRLENEDEWLDVSLDRLRRIDRAPSNPKWLREAGVVFSLTTDGLEEPEQLRTKLREALARGLSAEDALAALTTVPARQLGLADRLGTIEVGKIANLAVETGDPFAEKSRVAEIWIDGARYELAEKTGKTSDTRAKPAAPGEATARPFPGRENGPLAQPRAVIVRGATVWTQGPAGILENADVVVVDGKIVAVGMALTAPAGALEVDGRGKHVTPGIIDAHSHTSIDGQVNEGTHAVTAEVRVRDVLDPFDVAIYRELAGGTTTANVLHGSANAIGGQNAIVKWRLGGGPSDLLLAGAPEGIKFALGENPKQSNWQNPRPRYPATRMGVANLIRERFLAAQDYRKRQEEHVRAAAVKGANPVPPRKDLQLEAIAEILEGKRQIHCHSYRKDEILEMIRVAEEFGVKIATFQHVLEGYKVADEMARHGAGGSGFSDWWAYKVEVYDAIPYNGALMRERGVLVSFNSDSDELARRLNGEAAKAVRYGGVPPADALAFVTINPARQLGIDKRVGSLEPGKDADFVVWSGDPLSAESIALQAWIEGKKYFDREADLSRRAALETERADLVARAKRVTEADKKSEPADEKPTPTPGGMLIRVAPTPIPHLAPPGPTPTPPPQRRAAA